MPETGWPEPRVSLILTPMRIVKGTRFLCFEVYKHPKWSHTWLMVVVYYKFLSITIKFWVLAHWEAFNFSSVVRGGQGGSTNIYRAA
jgi:hypothetical protein